MEELKYSFTHRVEKTSLEDYHLETRLAEAEAEKSKRAKGSSLLRQIFKKHSLKNLFIIQEVFKTK